MNIFNRFFLFLVLLPSSLYKRMGVHIPHLRAILHTKLMIDDRRVSSIQQTRKRKKQKPPNYATIGTMFLSAIFGTVFLFSFSIGKDYLTQLTVYFSVYIFTLASVLIADFTSVLIDVRDTMIILPKPVNDKTFVLSRLLHIVIHVSKLVLPMALPGLIMMFVNEGARGGFAFGLMIVSATLFTIFLINAVYLVVLKITTPDKFKNIISYFQVGIAVFFYGGYQIVPRLISETALHAFSITQLKHAKWIVSYWFAAGWQFFQDFNLYSGLWVYVTLTVLLPFVSVWIVIRYFAPSFNQKLSMIGGSDSENITLKPKRNKVTSTTSAYITLLSKRLTEKGTERMSFLHTWKMTARSRDFKLKVYPMLGYLLVYLVLLLLKDGGISLFTTADKTKASYVFLSIIYFGSFLVMSAVQHLAYSEKSKAAWIYHITPISTPGKLFSGALKATILKFYFPVVVITWVCAIAMVGISILPNLLLATSNQVLIIAFGGYLVLRDPPFSVAPNTNMRGGSFLRVVVSMLIPFLIAVLHFLVYRYTVVVYILIVLSVIAAWMMMDAVKNRGWRNVRLREYAE